MKLDEIVQALQLTALVPATVPSVEVSGGYASDLLSNAMGQAAPGQIWVTMQGHPNVAAVASLLNLAGVIIAGGASVAPETAQKAQANGVALFTTRLPAYEVCGRLYALGVGKP
ncbi:MAG: serine kinase [Acidaminococcaceae bacterium]|jgi:hypothetical protein|nr:serine kinase [Acidaminococcaceae bacterium]